MDPKKVGSFLKSLRKEKNLTQERLAEEFHVSYRTVSRWETGRNMPDVAMLIALADFYHVDIREMIDGERQSSPSGEKIKDTLRKVADYAVAKEKGTQSKVTAIALGVTVALLICTILFTGESKGLLYGLIPETICEYILMLVYGISACLLIFYLRVRWWREVPSAEPERSIAATVVSKEIRPGTHGAGRSVMGYSFVIHFRTEDGSLLELYAYAIEYGSVREGTHGVLTYQGRYFVSFTSKSEKTDL